MHGLVCACALGAGFEVCVRHRVAGKVDSAVAVKESADGGEE